MEYQNYEEYMRQVLGYSPQNPNIYETYQYRNSVPYDNTYDRNGYMAQLSEDEANDLYPEIYQKVNPIICNLCSNNTSPITKELIEQMTDEVYSKVEEQNTVVNVRIETPKENTENRRSERNPSKLNEIRNTRTAITRTPIENRVSSEKKEARINKEPVENRSEKETAESRQMRRPQNSILRDLIKILILKQLLGGGNRPPVRPPRPPFPGGPGMPPPRPPYPDGRPPMGGGIMPRDYQNYFDF